MNNISSVCTYVFCKNEKGEICTLVGKRTSSAPTGANLYTPPMGMVELGENPYDAAVRECFEEAGIKLFKNKIKYHDKESYQMFGKQYTGVNFYIVLNGNISEYPIGKGDGENEHFIWLPLTQIDNIQWAFGTKDKINEIIYKLTKGKNSICLTESELKHVINESVKKVYQTLIERYM